MKKLLDIYMSVLEILIATLLVVMVVLVFGNVVLRYGFNSGILVSEEMSRSLFIWVTFLGSIIALRENAHLGSNFIIKHFGPRAKRSALVLGRVVMLYICWLVFSGALAQTRINADVAAPITGMSMGIFYASGIVFSVSAALILLGDILRLSTCPREAIDTFLDESGEHA
ncbi:MAG: TRAP transporter small permease [Castellaniella sp.]